MHTYAYAHMNHPMNKVLALQTIYIICDAARCIECTSCGSVLVAVVAVRALLLPPKLVVPGGHRHRLRLGRLEAALRARHRLVLLVPVKDIKLR